ncbi:hypothetical protein TrCOL_g7170 [Triparma columacea]|uniref:RNI-like protein n=1 Tax=Triparma columacea TaxID=722753 RepID=A0A9W7L822_9STRA|nr:hypothetical protein TrCOL_g7170 [Triparma columacea]
MYEECHGLLGVSLRSTNKDVALLFPSIPSSNTNNPPPTPLPTPPNNLPTTPYSKLDLGMNNSLDFSALALGLSRQPGLSSLSVDNCNMTSKSLQVLLASLYPSSSSSSTSSSSHTLKSLNISFNPLPPTSFSTLFATLTPSQVLLSLDASGIPMNLQAAKTVAYFLAHNTSLQSLKIRNCSLDVSSQRHITAGHPYPPDLKLADFTWLRFYDSRYDKGEHESLKSQYSGPPPTGVTVYSSSSPTQANNKRRRKGLGRTVSMASFGEYGKSRIEYYPRIKSYLETLTGKEHFLTLKRLSIIESNTETGRIYGEAVSSVNYGFTVREIQEFVLGGREGGGEEDGGFKVGEDFREECYEGKGGGGRMMEGKMGGGI